MTEKSKNTRKYEPAVHESIDKYLAAIRYLTEHKIPFSDKTPFGGALWVFITDPESEQITGLASASGLKFSFSQKGGAASHNKPAWYYRASGKPDGKGEEIQKEKEPAPTTELIKFENDDNLPFAAMKNPKWKWNTYIVDEKRIKRALEIPKNSMQIDIANESAVMESEPNRKTGEIVNHTVTLTNCSCQDFHINCRENKPCKHIIRLAMELGILNENGILPEQQLENDIFEMKKRIAMAFGMYYIFDSPIYSDREYDEMKEYLAQLERKV